MRHSRFRTILLAGCAGMALSPAFALAQTQQQPRAVYNIPAQDLGTALTQFGQQSEREIVFSADLTRNRRARAVSGEMSTGEALAMLLGDSGLTYRTSPSGSIIVEASDPQSGSAAGDGANGTVAALVVTAQKREENIQDVPIAMSAFTQEDLTRSQVAGGPDLMTQVPNFTFTKTNFTGYSIQIRGIGTQAISATTDAAVAVAFNNTPFIRNRFFEQEFYDLQRVEVLRGPQGTLYGRNATAGVVNLISTKPSFHYEAKLSADVGNYNSTRLEGMANLPLVDDKVALRLSGAWTKRDGYDTNQISGNQIDGRNLWSTRVSLRFTPTDRLDANLIWEHFEENDDRLRSAKQLCHQDDRTDIQGYTVPPINGYSALFSQGCLPASLYSPDSYEAPNGFALPYYHPLSEIFLPTKPGFNPYASLTQSPNLRVIESTYDPNYKAKSDTVEFQWNLDLGNNLTLTSETGYGSDFIFSTEDFNRFNTAHGAFDTQISPNAGPPREGILQTGEFGGIFCDPQLGCADRVVAVDLSTARSRQFSQEFRVSSDYGGPFNFSLGANFLRYDTEDKYYVFINTLTMYAAISPYSGFGGLQGMVSHTPWQPGVSDNRECMLNGLRAPDPNVIQAVVGCVYIDPNPIGNLNDQGHNYFLSRNPYKLISYALFGEAYYNIRDNLKLTAGLRWTVDKKEAPRIPSWVLAAGTAGYPTAEVIDQEWREPTGRLTLDWKPSLSFTDQTLVYGSYSHGYKAGGANPPAAGIVTLDATSVGDPLSAAAGVELAGTATHPKTFAPEFVNAFEVGTKNTMDQGKLTLNADAFYYDYTGYQISQIIDRSAVNYNFDARIWGLEFEADWRPLENLRLGLKLGYENTKVADGSKAIDIMDRTAGTPGWVVVRPFPTFTSNCIVPIETVTHGGGILDVGNNSNVNGLPGPCEFAYLLHLDPVTSLPYKANPTEGAPGSLFSAYPEAYANYAGFNPDDPRWNGGQGFFKDLSGNELPNAPHYTATITADYTLPLPSDWLLTLHTDLYYQSEAWTRIFNTPGYGKLKAYNNMNLAAIFSNEDAGWKVMAYVKNVFNKDNITGAFLNSDDTGLTTNVFLNEPRLYGLRVTKDWTGDGWWTGANPNHPAGEPYPLTIEISGQVQRQDAPYRTMLPDQFYGSDGRPVFSPTIDTTRPQNRDLDWGDGRELRLTYRPVGSAWQVAADVRYGRTNSGTTRIHQEEVTGAKQCAFLMDSLYGQAFCNPQAEVFGQPPGHYYQAGDLVTPRNWSDSSARSGEDHLVADFAVGRDMGLGMIGVGRSVVDLGLQYARFKSTTDVTMDGVPDRYVPEGWFKYNSSQDHYTAAFKANREFKGAGPTLSWNATAPLVGSPQAGHLDLDWSVTGGVLFGKQRTSIEGTQTSFYWTGKYRTNPRIPDPLPAPTPIDIRRDKSVSVPLVDLSLGLSYEIQRIKVGAGYRWERYYNVLDAGYGDHKSYDRTFDGPYFKIAAGFGG